MTMTRTNDRPPLSADVILEAARRHGLTLAPGLTRDGDRICAIGAYAIACQPRLAGVPYFTIGEAEAVMGLSQAEAIALMLGFEQGDSRSPAWSWILSDVRQSVHRAYHVGREVWQEVQRRAQTPAEPPIAVEDDGPPDDGSAEPALAGVGADDFEPDDHWRSSSGG